MPITRFEDIEAWQEARNLTRIVYEITHTDRFRRDFGLTDQIRRASVSIRCADELLVSPSMTLRTV